MLIVSNKRLIRLREYFGFEIKECDINGSLEYINFNTSCKYKYIRDVSAQQYNNFSPPIQSLYEVAFFCAIHD